ncbi:MAG: Uncharacterised protein [Methanobacteriota archaeon]|nr:MAG: Uncharacterised protein [Euryarchaeota archaeon]
MNELPKITKYEIGMAGELFVASECFRRGIWVSITMGNHKTVDLMAQNPKSGDVKCLEVKSKSPKDGAWIFDITKNARKNLLYVLVDYRGYFRDHIERTVSNVNKNWRPKCYIIPSKEIRKYWKPSKYHKSGVVPLSKIRHLNKYHEKWSLIFDNGVKDGPLPKSKRKIKSKK